MFGPGRAVPLDRNAKVRIAAYARAWSARNRRPRQHNGPITMRLLSVSAGAAVVLPQQPRRPLLPGYERDRRAGRCARSTVAEALKVLEWAGVLTWQHRITRSPRTLHRPVRPHRLAMAGDPHVQRLRVPRPESRRLPPAFFQVRKSARNTGSRYS